MKHELMVSMDVCVFLHSCTGDCVSLRFGLRMVTAATTPSVSLTELRFISSAVSTACRPQLVWRPPMDGPACLPEADRGPDMAVEPRMSPYTSAAFVAACIPLQARALEPRAPWSRGWISMEEPVFTDLNTHSPASADDD